MIINQFSIETLTLADFQRWHLHRFDVSEPQQDTVELAWEFGYFQHDALSEAREHMPDMRIERYMMSWYTGEVALRSRGVELTWEHKAWDSDRAVIMDDPHRDRRQMLHPRDMSPVFRGVGEYKQLVKDPDTTPHALREALADLEKKARTIARRYVDVWREAEGFPPVLFMMYLEQAVAYREFVNASQDMQAIETNKTSEVA